MKGLRVFIGLLALVFGFMCGAAWKTETGHAKPESAVNAFSLKQGVQCKVQIRFDALGDHASLTGDTVNGKGVNVSGTFLGENSEWLILKSEEKEIFWIPKSVVLLVREAD